MIADQRLLVREVKRVNDLIEGLEKATGPDRGLDGMIARDVLGWLPYFDLEGDRIVEWYKYGGHWHLPCDACDGEHSVDRKRNPDPPCFTTSIDAALTLVPEGWFGSVPLRRNADAWLRQSNDGPMIYGRHTCEAIALCIAALKARAHCAGERPET